MNKPRREIKLPDGQVGDWEVDLDEESDSAWIDQLGHGQGLYETTRSGVQKLSAGIVDTINYVLGTSVDRIRGACTQGKRSSSKRLISTNGDGASSHENGKKLSALTMKSTSYTK